MKTKLLSFFFIGIVCNVMHANIVLPNLFSDNMVLQRNSEVKLWGWANPGEEVIVTTSWNAKEYKIKGDNQAKWQIEVSTPEAGGPFEINFKGYNEVRLANILIGEVWICSGQSNMEMTPSWGILDGEQEIQRANYPNIRFFTVPKITATSPQIDVPGKWEVCTPETMKNSSAIAYFFAQKLSQDMNGIPVGVIVSAWGGTPAEIWIPQNEVETDPILLESAKRVDPNEWRPHEPGRAFNAMIHPIIGFKIAGALWYQGETNVGSLTYQHTLTSLIQSWRNLWKNDFPFYFVQIAPYNYGEDHFSGVIVRDSQRKVVNSASKTAMVVTSDIATTDDIHPKDKKSVGIRLANLAETNLYKISSSTANGPLFKEAIPQGKKISVVFDFGEGLHFKNKTSDQFEVAGNDGVFYPAKASIKNNTVQLQSEKVSMPVKVRYSWKNNALADLFNSVNLPASSFQSE